MSGVLLIRFNSAFGPPGIGSKVNWSGEKAKVELSFSYNLIDHYYHSLSMDGTVIVSKTGPKHWHM